MNRVSGRRVRPEALLVVLLASVLTACGAGGGPFLGRTVGSGGGSVASKGIGPGAVPTPHKLTVQSSPAAGGTVVSNPAGISCGSVCSTSFVAGSSVTLTVSPALNYAFSGWGGACTGTGACTVQLDSDQSVTAAFSPSAPTQNSLTVSISGPGLGTVASNPAGISCSSSCSALFNFGSTVVLTPTAQAGSTFSGWTGACSGTGACSVTMSSAQAVGASFIPTAFPVNVSVTGTGTVTSAPAGINCGATCSANFATGTNVALTATAGGGASFAGWTGACSGSGTCDLTVGTTASDVAAVFSAPLTLTVLPDGTGTGTITSTDSTINCGATCSATYGSGTVVTLSAAASAGSSFTGWTGACSGTGNCAVTITAAKAVGATFTSTSVPVSVTLDGTGSGSVTSLPSGINCGSTCTANFDSGSTVTLTATAPSGSVFAGWTGACSGTGSCSLNIGSTAQAVGATFSPQAQFDLTVALAGSGSGTVTSSPSGISCGATCQASYSSGTTVTLTATADPGMAFAGWNSAVCSGVGNCTVTITSAQTITATFVPVFPLSVSVTGAGQGTVTSAPLGISCPSLCNANFNQGSTVTLTASAGSGFGFNGWSVACSGTGSCKVTMTGAQSVTADFEPTKTSIAPFLTVTPSTLSFGSVQTGTLATLTVQLSNTGGTGTGDLTVTSAVADNGLFNVPTAQFPIVLHDDGTSQAMTIQFSPQVTGNVLGNVTFTSNGANSPTLIVTGSGTTSGNSGGSLTVGPSTIYFGTVSVGTTSTQTVTMSNPGSATTQVTAGTVSGGGFSIDSPTFPLTLAPGDTKIVAISFTPTTAGASTGVITFTSNAVGGTPVVSLVASGTGSDPLTSVTVAPSDLSFGNVTVSSTALWFVTLYNTGNTTVNVTNANIVGSNFAVDSSVLPVQIPVNGSQQVTVSFKPLSASQSTATLSFSTNASGPAPSVNLTGNGVIASAHTVNLGWQTSASPNATGYNVYRSTTSGFGFQKINGAPISTTAFADNSVASGQTYYYVVTALTATGVESTYSNEVFATIP